MAVEVAGTFVDVIQEGRRADLGAAFFTAAGDFARAVFFTVAGDLARVVFFTVAGDLA